MLIAQTVALNSREVNPFGRVLQAFEKCTSNRRSARDGHTGWIWMTVLLSLGRLERIDMQMCGNVQFEEIEQRYRVRCMLGQDQS